MKLIEPIENLSLLSTSNAVIDSYETWEPEGRDLLSTVAYPVFDVVGDLMVISSTQDGASATPAYTVDLSTGDVSLTGFTSTYNTVNIDISPDGLHTCICTRHLSGYLSFTILSTTDWSVEYYSGTIYANTASVPSLTIYNNIAWASDSDHVAIASGQTLRIIETTGFTENELDLAAGEQFLTLMYSSDNDSFIMSSRTLYVIEVDTAGTLLNYEIYAGGLFPGKGHITAFMPQTTSSNHLALMSSGIITELNASTLNLQATPAGLSGSFFGGAKSIKATATHLITRSLSTAPYWNYRLMTDYSLDKSLPDLPYPGEGIAVGTNYTVVQQVGGFSLIQNSDDSIVSQTNPSVTTGDTYIYNENIYEALIDNTDQPDEGVALEIPTWLDTGKINTLRMFDGKLNSLTAADDTLTINITPAQLTSGLALFNVDANTVTIRMTIDETVEINGSPVNLTTVVYEKIISMVDNSGVTNWFNYYFDSYIKRTDIVVVDLPPYPEAIIKITIDADGEPVEVGEIALGKVRNLGIAQFGTSASIIDFSEKSQDEFGNYTIIERKFSKRADYDVKIPTNTVSGVQKTLSRFRATPAVWVGDVNREETIIYGYYKSFDIVLSNPALSDTAILVEGL